MTTVANGSGSNELALFAAAATVVTGVGERAAKIGGEIGVIGGDMDGLANSGFTTQPATELFRRGDHEAPLASDGHAGFGPALSGRNRLAKMFGDLLPAFEKNGLTLFLGHRRSMNGGIGHVGVRDDQPVPSKPLHHNHVVPFYRAIREANVVCASVVAQVA